MEREIAEREGETASVTGFLTAVGQAIAGVFTGWRASPRHEHDQADAEEARADAAVTKAIHDGAEKARKENT